MCVHARFFTDRTFASTRMGWDFWRDPPAKWSGGDEATAKAGDTARISNSIAAPGYNEGTLWIVAQG